MRDDDGFVGSVALANMGRIEVVVILSLTSCTTTYILTIIPAFITFEAGVKRPTISIW